MSEILATTKMLCELAMNENGHLPSSLPVRQRSHPYVQICHGSPGLILLLATLRRLRPSEWRTDSIFANTLEHASNAVWVQGLTKKGLGICHGVSGNAWVLLMTGEEKWAEKALALLMEARDMPPLGDKKFNIPDAPWSLFEGVAGTVAAWSEAAAWLERGEEGLMGFPGLGGVGAVGVL